MSSSSLFGAATPRGGALVHSAAMALAALTAVVAVTAASAQQFGRSATDPWSGGISVVDQTRPPEKPLMPPVLAGINRPDISVTSPGQPAPKPKKVKSMRVDLAPVINARWEAAKPQIKARIEAELKERAIGGGFRTSRNHLTLGSVGAMFVGTDGRGFTIRFLVPGNAIATRLRVPSDLSSSSTDPAFNVPFDLDVMIDVEVRDDRLFAMPAKVRANVRRPEGRNFLGDVAIAFNNLFNFVGGPDFIGLFQAQINARTFTIDTGINDALARLNPLLHRVSGGRGALRPGYRGSTHDMVIELVDAGPPPRVN